MPPARAAFYLATLGGIVLTARAVLIGPPPLWASVLAAAAYVAIVLAGVLSLRLRMFADAVVRGPARARGVALTFDDVDPAELSAVLEALDRAGAQATFFFFGERADGEAIRAAARRGHAIGLHGHARDRPLALRGPRRVRRDLERAVRALEAVTEARPSLFRPPSGWTNPTIARVADQLELTIAGWSAGQRTRALRDGDVVRIDREPSRALPDVLAAIDAQNLCVAPLSAWIDEEWHVGTL
jgi:peptidoglycan/xylan/chitin deacetylase (PgdA/CDA1 family)